MAKAKAKAKDPAGDRARDTAALGVIQPLAAEINAAWEAAEKSDGRANDLRLTAAYKLGEARAACDKHKLNFKKWCEENVTITYRTARELVSIGRSKNPPLALADLRAKTAKRVSAHTARKKKASGAPTSAGRTVGKAAIAGPTPFMDIMGRARSLPEKQQVTLASELAASAGLVVGPVVAAGARADVGAVKAAIKALSAPERRTLFRWLTALVELDAQAAASAPPPGDLTAIPPFLDRRPVKKVKT